MPEQAIHLFHQIKDPNDIICLLLFNACAQLRNKDALDLIKNVSRNMPSKFFSNVNLVTSLIDGLAKCGDIEGAQSIFDSSKQKTSDMLGALMKGVCHLLFYV